VLQLEHHLDPRTTFHKRRPRGSEVRWPHDSS
jgi:hypothetical protein